METLKTYKKSIMRMYRQSFFKGMGGIMAIPGNYFPLPDFSHPHDATALKSDWEAVGSYIRNSFPESNI